VLSHYTIIADRGTNDKKTKKTTVLLSSGLDLGLAEIVSVTSLLGYRSLRRLTDQDYFRVCLTISTDKCDIGCGSLAALKSLRCDCRDASTVWLCIGYTVAILWPSIGLEVSAFSALTLLVGRQEEHPVCKN